MIQFLKTPTLTLAAMAVSLLFADDLPAQIVFEDGGINVVDSALAQFIIVRDSAMGVPTTVLVQAGAAIPNQGTSGTPSIVVEDSSIVEMSGGETVGHFNTFDNAIGFFTGGIVGDEVRTFGNSMMTVGSPKGMGGVIDIEDDLESDDNSRIDMYEGRVFDDVEARGTSEMNLFGGEYDEDIEAMDNSVINIFGGLYNTGFGDPDDIEGGEIAAEDSGTGVNAAVVNVHGGTFVGALFDPDFKAEGNGTINIFGSDFAVNGVPVGFGQLAAITGQLTGTLEDGSTLNNDFEQIGNGRIILVEAAGCDFEIGDVNQDGVVSLLDVNPFVILISSSGFQCEADINEDGAVTLLDVNLFVQLLTGG